MNKSNYFLVCVFLLLCPLFLAAQSKAEQQIADLEDRRFEAMVAKDVDFLRNVLSDQVTYSHSNGLVENKKEHLQNVGSGSIEYLSMTLEKSNIRVFKKTAVNNGVILVKGRYKGTVFDIRLGFTDVYVKSKRQWKLLAWQSVKLE